MKASLLVYVRASQLERESAPIDSIESSSEDHIFIATLRFVPPSASPSASSSVSRFDAPGDSISVIAVVLEINRKQ